MLQGIGPDCKYGQARTYRINYGESIATDLR